MATKKKREKLGYITFAFYKNEQGDIERTITDRLPSELSGEVAIKAMALHIQNRIKKGVAGKSKTQRRKLLNGLFEAINKEVDGVVGYE